MSKRTSGLGRGLGDLLADNAPELRGGATVIRRDEDGEVTVTPDAADAIEKIEETNAESNDADVSSEVLEQSGGASEADNSSDEEEKVIVITPSEAKNVDISPTNTETAADVSPSENSETVHHPHRSLKALFRSYK